MFQFVVRTCVALAWGITLLNAAVLHAFELKVMSFNVWAGADGREADAIIASGADIIGIQESSGTTASLAGMLGMYYAALPDGSNSILSRFPITQVYNRGVKIDLGEQGDAYIFSVHLASSPYQPYQIHPQSPQLGWGPTINTGSHDGDVAAAVAQANAARSGQITAVLNEIATKVPQGAKVFLVGDFNEPSHLDWTEEAGPNGAGLHTHVVPWPTSIKVINAGFIDSYRTLYPNEVTHPGYTWTTLNNNPEVHDRIDFVYFRGEGMTLMDVQLVGDPGMAGGQLSDITLSNYPSDHRAVLATFLLPEPVTLVLLLGTTPLLLRRRT